MKMMAVSDVHGFLDGLDESIDMADVVVIAGDVQPCLMYVDPMRFILDEFYGMCRRHGDKKFVMTPGNHDFLFDSRKHPDDFETLEKEKPDNLNILIDSGIDIDGIRFWGTPWVPYISGHWAFESIAVGEYDIEEKFMSMPDGVDVLITHSPPYTRNGFLDVSTQRMNDKRHFGSRTLAYAIGFLRPKITICGHIHTGKHGATTLLQGCEVIDGAMIPSVSDIVTTAFNVSRIDEKYEIEYDPTMLKIEKSGSDFEFETLQEDGKKEIV